MMKEKDLTAYCGLYCGDCIRYKCKASDLAGELLNEIKKVFFAEYAKVKKIHTKEFDDFNSFTSKLKAISELKCNTPCRLGGDGCGGSCEIKRCVQDKALEGCWECDIFENCERFEFLKPFHADGPINNLREIKRHGLAGWATYRDKCYPWM